MRIGLLSVGLALAFAGSCTAAKAAPCQGRPETSAYAAAYDPDRGLTLSFGGVDAVGRVTSDLWGWNGEAWSCVTGAGPSGPTPRTDAVMAYDAARRMLVLYGGRGRAAALSDTWEFGAGGWSLKASAGPTDQPHGAFAYDARSGGVLMYQPVSDDDPHRKTWLWNGENWSEKAAGPDRQYPNAMMPGDASRPAMLITARRLEGADGFEALLYAWSGERWSEVQGQSAPPVFSPQAPTARTVDQVVLFAGFEESGVVATWVFEGVAWRRHAGESPSRRKGAQLTFDSRRSVIVLHGGDDGSQVLNDTWEWDGSNWRRVSPGA